MVLTTEGGAGSLLLVIADDWNSHCWLSWPNGFAIAQRIVSQCVQYLDPENFFILSFFLKKKKRTLTLTL